MCLKFEQQINKIDLQLEGLWNLFIAKGAINNKNPDLSNSLLFVQHSSDDSESMIMMQLKDHRKDHQLLEVSAYYSLTTAKLKKKT